LKTVRPARCQAQDAVTNVATPDDRQWEKHLCKFSLYCSIPVCYVTSCSQSFHFHTLFRSFLLSYMFRPIWPSPGSRTRFKLLHCSQCTNIHRCISMLSKLKSIKFNLNLILKDKHDKSCSVQLMECSVLRVMWYSTSARHRPYRPKHVAWQKTTNICANITLYVQSAR
jgi:hypothetical protein